MSDKTVLSRYLKDASELAAATMFGGEFQQCSGKLDLRTAAEL